MRGMTVNYIDSTETSFVQANSDAIISALWRSDGTITSDTITYLDSAYGSLKLVPSATSNYVKYNIYAVPTAQDPSQFAITSIWDPGSVVESFMWLRSTVNCTVYLKTVLTKVILNTSTYIYELSSNVNDVINGSENSMRIETGVSDLTRWKLLRAMPALVPDDIYRYSIGLHLRVEFDTLTNATLNIARPTALNSFNLSLNNFGMRTYGTLPQAFIEQDIADFATNKPTWALARLIDVCTSSQNAIYENVQNIRYIDNATGRDENNLNSLSTLVSPLNASVDVIRWLAQFRGRELIIAYEPSTNGEEWQSFLLDDPIYGLLDGGGVLSTSAISQALPGGVLEYFKWQVHTGYYGHNAGTIEAIVSAVKRVLTGPGIVNYLVSSNSVELTTSWTETFGAVIGDIGASSPYVLSVVEPTRPLGVVITHTLTA